MTSAQQPDTQSLSPLKRALVVIETLQEQLAAAQRSSTRRDPSDAIAIVGASCRLPGAIDDLDTYWAFLRASGEARREVPKERWNADAYYDPDPEAPGKMVSRFGGFRERIDEFDAAFFGISPREASQIDPQHRLILEAAWEALEDAGQACGELLGSRTGVFVGIMNADYAKLQFQDGDYRAVNAYSTTGTGMSFAAGRIAYVLGLQGPCVAVDTACSSSLVAIHQAVRSLRSGECDLALAGGVSLMVTPELGVFLSKARVLAGDGRCKTFDAAADGIGRGEGGGMVVLKRLNDAVAAGDRILCIVRGSAVNHDGRSGGLTVPSGSAQAALIRAALADAGVEPGQIGYLEAHGTGTSLGDLVEGRALAAVFGPGRKQSLFIGSVKTNLGHLDAAAGIAGLLKVAMAVRHAEIPANLHFNVPNPEIPWAEAQLDVAVAPRPWSVAEGKRLAGISSFGLSGVNAHVIVEEPPAADENQPATGESKEEDAAGPWLLPLSARSDAALEQLASSYAARLLECAAPAARIKLADIVASASLRRDHFERRIAVLADDHGAMAKSLERLARGEQPERLWRGGAAVGEAPRVAFIFSGMGVSPLGVGRQLLQREQVFRRALEEADAVLRRHADISVLRLVSEAKDVGATLPIDVLQPLLFALSVALCAQWRSWGIQPDAVVGHSMGEAAAAHISGALSLDDAARVVCARSRLLRQVSGKGAMAAVGLPANALAERLAAQAPLLAIAAINAPQASVISGEPRALGDFLARLEAEGVECRRLDVDIAFHGPQMDPLLAPLREELAGLSPENGTAVLHSTVTGRSCIGSELRAEHWLGNLRKPVRFAAAVASLVGSGSWLLIEVGPHPILRPHMQAVAPNASLCASLRRGVDEREAMLAGLAEAYVAGAAVAWRGVHSGPSRNVRLPTYPWQCERHWLAASPEALLPAVNPPITRGVSHPLLGTEIALALNPRVACFQQRLSVESLGELADHRVRGRVVLPGTAIAELALAARAPDSGPQLELKDLQFRRPLSFEDAAGRAQAVQTTVEWRDDGTGSFQLASHAENGAWLVHATASLAPMTAQPTAGEGAGISLRDSATAGEDSVAFYAGLAARGLTYGPVFRGIARLWRGAGEALAELGAWREPGHYQVHPATLDSALHVLLAALAESAGEALLVPTQIGALRVHTRPTSAHAPLFGHARVREASAGVYTGDVRLLAADGSTLVELQAVQLRLLDPPADQRAAVSVIVPSWELLGRPARPTDARAASARWLLIAAKDGVADTLLAEARSKGIHVFRADPGAPLALDERYTDVIVLCRDDRDPAHATAELLAAAQADGVERVLAVVSSMLELPEPELPRLWLVTEGSQAVQPGDPVVPTHAAVWGFGRTLGYEHPQLQCSLVDIEGKGHAAELVEEVLGGGGEAELALRADRRHAGRLSRGQLPTAAVRVRPDSSYLVTGGLSGLGLSAAEWLAEQGARQLVLVGRSGVATDEARAGLARLRERGCEVLTEAVDVADDAAVAALFAQIEAKLPALRGIVHAAGVLDDGVILRGDAAWLRRAMAPKLRGSWNLHLLSRGMELDFFVLYGSVSGLMGAPAQANYAAGNAFVQALAHHRRAQGLTATCIDWGAFSEVGMAAASALRGDRLRERGIDSMTPHEGTDALGRVLGGDWTQLGLARFDARAWLLSYPHLRGSPRFAPLLDRSDEAAESLTGPAASSTGHALRSALLAAPAPQRAAVLEGELRREVAKVMRLDPERIDASSPLANFGLDSLMALELRNRLESSTGVRLSVSSLLQTSGIALLATELLERLASASLLDAVREVGPVSDEDQWEVIRL